MSSKKAIQKYSQAYYFKYFTLSAISFLLGLGTVIYVEMLLPESTQQEWLALIGLILCIPSGLMAFYCYLRLLFARLQHFMDK